MEDSKIDQATEFTLQYLDLLEKLLKIEYTDSGAPIFIPDRIDNKDIQRLRSYIGELHEGRLKDRAIGDMQSYSTHKIHRIQTTAVGYAESFDMQVKLGLLLGQRLILWDTVVLSILSVSDDEVDLNTLGKVANGLIQLRPLANAGALILLPQPKTWLERAAKYYSLMPSEATVSSTFKGYVNAVALLQEGIVLHPYLMQNQMDYRKTIESLPKSVSPYYSKEKAGYHHSLLRILKSANLEFLDNIDAVRFYKEIHDMGKGVMRQFQRELAQKLSFPQSAMSDEEKEQYLDEIVEELEGAIPSVMRNIKSQHVDSSHAGVKAIQATFGLIADAGTAGAFSAILSGLGAIGSVRTFLKKIETKSVDPILFQVFSQLKTASEFQLSQEIQDESNVPGTQIDQNSSRNSDL